jgi:hypothetical protein
MSPPPLTADQFEDPFRYLAAKQAEFERDQRRARAALKECGWTLRPNHPVSAVWRAGRWTKKDGSLRLSAPSVDELLELVRAEYETRRKAKEAKKKAAEEKRKAKEARRERPRK